MSQKDFQITLDSGETIAVPRDMFTHVEKMALARVRPTKFREVLQIDSSIPWYMESYEYDLMKETAQWTPAQEFSDDFAAAAVSIGKERFPLVELVSGYQYRDREIVRANAIGFSLDAARAAAVLKKAETMLDHIAIDGTLDGVRVLDGSIKGLFNQTATGAASSASSFTQGTAVRVTDGFATGASWEYQKSQATTDALHNVWCERVINDVLKLEIVSERATAETTPIDKVVLPLSVAPLLQNTKVFSNGDSIEKEILKRARYIKSVIYWNAADAQAFGADGTHKRRIVGLPSNDLDAARIVMPRAPTPGKPIQILHGVRVPVNMVTGGFNSKILHSLVYADLADVAVTS